MIIPVQQMSSSAFLHAFFLLSFDHDALPEIIHMFGLRFMVIRMRGHSIHVTITIPVRLIHLLSEHSCFLVRIFFVEH